MIDHIEGCSVLDSGRCTCHPNVISLRTLTTHTYRCSACEGLMWRTAKNDFVHRQNGAVYCPQPQPDDLDIYEETWE